MHQVGIATTYFYSHLMVNSNESKKLGIRSKTKTFCITFIQCWTNVEDVGPTLYKCYKNVLCLLD